MEHFTSSLLVGLLLGLMPLAQGQLTTLVEFTGNGEKNKGGAPNGLVLGYDGNFYGGTHSGGANGFGTLFKVSATGSLTTLVEFTGKEGSARGCSPSGPLVQTKDGNFYGVTQGGNIGFGTVFRMTSSGSMTTLVDFTDQSPPNLGSHPYAGLVEGRDGNLYGTTFAGGSGKMGTVFRMTPEGELTTLVNFKMDLSKNGMQGPWCRLVQAIDGNLWGTTWMGGGVPNGGGTVFKVTADGVKTLVGRLTGMGPKTTGGGPMAGVVQDREGNFYGVTPVFGLNNRGTVYKITPDGKIRVLVNFTGDEGSAKGAACEAELLEGQDGNFYGVTSSGGATGWGTLFQMKPDGAFTTLVEFTNTSGERKGSHPQSELVQGNDGCLYGTTLKGGTNNEGTIFKLAVATDGVPDEKARATLPSEEAPPIAQPVSSGETAAAVATPPGEFPETETRLLTGAEIKAWDDARLQRAINEMYARHGADFKDAALKKEFQRFAWYQPEPGRTYDMAEAGFSQIEKRNVRMLGEWRKNGGNGGGELARSATVVDSPPDQQYGNIQVDYADGHSEVWTKGGLCSDPHVSGKGEVGWVFARCSGAQDWHGCSAGPAARWNAAGISAEREWPLH